MYKNVQLDQEYQQDLEEDLQCNWTKDINITPHQQRHGVAGIPDKIVAPARKKRKCTMRRAYAQWPT